MKKIALILVAALLLGMMAPAMAAVSPADILGTWYLSSFDYDGFTAVINGDYRVEFNRDKSALLVLNGEEQQLTWELSDYGANVKFESGFESFELQEDGTLKASQEVINQDGSYCFFVREQPEVAEPPVAVAVSDESEFFGTYVLTLQKIGDVLIPFENGGEILTGKIEFALVTLSGSGVGSSETSVMSDYKDEKVIIPAYGFISGVGEDNKLFIEKTDSGIMVTCDAVPDMVYFLSPVDEAEEAAPAEEGAGE